MGINMLDKPVGIFAHLEEISLLLCGLNLSSAIGTLAVHKLGFWGPLDQA